MANETDPLAVNVHGTDPQNLIEKIVRDKIHECQYWKEECFGLSAEALVDKAVEVNYLGGTVGGAQKPCPFLCLIAKMLQIQPEKEITVEFIKNEDYKYVRLLGAFYLRLVGKATEVYQYLEPLYNDYRKVRVRQPDGVFVLSHVDEIVDSMMQKDHLFDISLPRIPLRVLLERSGALEPRASVLVEEYEANAEDEARAKEAAEAEEQRQKEAKEKERVMLKNKERVRVNRRRSRSPERRKERDDDRHHRDHDRRHRHSHRRHRDDDRRSRQRRSKSPERKHEKNKDKTDDREIIEANALRAKLGLKPLK